MCVCFLEGKVRICMLNMNTTQEPEKGQNNRLTQTAG